MQDRTTSGLDKAQRVESISIEMQWKNFKKKQISENKELFRGTEESRM
jgi:hypothetical protein